MKLVFKVLGIFLLISLASNAYSAEVTVPCSGSLGFGIGFSQYIKGCPVDRNIAIYIESTNGDFIASINISIQEVSGIEYIAIDIFDIGDGITQSHWSWWGDMESYGDINLSGIQATSVVIRCDSTFDSTYYSTGNNGFMCIDLSSYESGGACMLYLFN